MPPTTTSLGPVADGLDGAGVPPVQAILVVSVGAEKFAFRKWPASEALSPKTSLSRGGAALGLGPPELAVPVSPAPESPDCILSDPESSGVVPEAPDDELPAAVEPELPPVALS